MKRVIVDHFGGPEVLKVVQDDDPRPGTGEVRVRVLAAGVSFTDAQLRAGTYIAGGPKHTESDNVEPGTAPVCVDTPWGKMGLSVCYDLRFPELYRVYAQQGARVLFVPAAFTSAARRHVVTHVAHAGANRSEQPFGRERARVQRLAMPRVQHRDDEDERRRVDQEHDARARRDRDERRDDQAAHRGAGRACDVVARTVE